MESQLTLWVGFFSLFVTSICSPLLVAYVQFTIKRAETARAEKREDQVAAKAAETSQTRAREAAAAKAEAIVVRDKLDAVHAIGESTHLLVNSKMSAVLRSLRAALREIISLKQERGDQPDTATLKEIEHLDKRITEIDEIVNITPV